MTAPETRPVPTPTSSPGELVDAVSAAVRTVPGVADLHAGVFGEVGTYLPGRRVAGITIGDGGAEIHVALLVGYPVRETAAMVRAAVAPLTGGPVHVTVEDVVASAGPDPDPVPRSSATGSAEEPGVPGDDA